MFRLFKRSSVDASRIPTFSDVVDAQENIRSILPVTPLTHSFGLSELTGREVLCKWDNRFPTGSFKERGAANFLYLLSRSTRTSGVCTASAGNHALAVSRHAKLLGLPCTIVMPKYAPLVKVEMTQRNGAKVLLEAMNFEDAYQRAQSLAKQEHLTFIPGFDHPWIVSGQGTCGLEILDQDAQFDSVLVSVGGGGLAAGVALAIKEKRPDVFIMGVQSDWITKRHHLPKNSDFLVRGTIADGIAVKNIGHVPQQILDSCVDVLTSVSDDEIAHAVVRCLELERVVIEGAGAASLAALLHDRLPPQYTRPVVILGGSNIDANLLSRLIDREHRRKGRLFRLRVSVPDRPGSLAFCTKLISENAANVLETFHDRRFSSEPGNVDITFLLEVRDTAHQDALMGAFQERGVLTFRNEGAPT